MMPVVIGLSHRTAPVEIRERMAIPAGAVSDSLKRLVAAGDAGEAVILSTCNRVEIYAALEGESPAADPLVAQLASWSGLSPDMLAPHLVRREGIEAVRHLYRVASGVDSLVVGESEILGQVKEAYLLAVQAQSVGRLLNPMFQSAFRAAKDVRTRTGISRRRVSVGSVAVELAGKIFGDLAAQKALVVGAGEMAARTLENLAEAGVRAVTVCNRSPEAAAALAARFSGRAVPFDRLEEGLVEADIVISSTGAPHAIITRAALARVLQRRRHRPLFVIDIAVPRDVEASAADLGDLFLYDIDDLERVVGDNLRERQKEIAECERIIDAAARAFAERNLARGAENLLRSLAAELERVGIEEMRGLWKEHPEIPPERRREVELTVRRLLDRIADRPAETIRREIAAGDGLVLMDSLRKLFRL